MVKPPVWHIRHLGRTDYHRCWEEMRSYTLARTPHSRDQLWFTEHDSVYTLGRAASLDNILEDHNVPVVRTDRGGEVTYHGKGQLVAYILFDLVRAGTGIRSLVSHIENAVLKTLDELHVRAWKIAGRPGVYTTRGKIAALGLSCKRRGTYHGLSVNVDMDLRPFQWINPCGMTQSVTDLKAHSIRIEQLELATILAKHLSSPVAAV